MIQRAKHSTNYETRANTSFSWLVSHAISSYRYPFPSLPLIHIFLLFNLKKKTDSKIFLNIFKPLIRTRKKQFYWKI